MQLFSLKPSRKNLSDEMLIKQIAGQNTAAFNEFCRRHHQPLTHFLQRTTQRPELAEEILNDSLFVVWQKAATFQGNSKPSTWLFGIAYNKAMKALNRLQRSPETEAAELNDHYEAVHGLPEALLENKQTREKIQQIIVALSPEHRAVIELTYFAGYSCSEIADIVGCPTNTVKTRMFHARANLKQLLAAAVASGSISYD